MVTQKTSDEIRAGAALDDPSPPSLAALPISASSGAKAHGKGGIGRLVLANTSLNTMVHADVLAETALPSTAVLPDVHGGVQSVSCVDAGVIVGMGTT